ncbi:MAG: glycerol-3-phosphate dehydrogenase/oxidase, partial [Candidatus Nanopelagicales bacterium]
VGGGITGTGIALDAATRGLSVGLVEAEDLAFGTSRWSSRLAHGGLRYLANGDIGVAWESAVERGRLMETVAPHLIRPLAHVMPFYASSARRERLLVPIGLRAADLMRSAAGTSRRTLGRPRHLTAQQAVDLAPGLATDGLRGATLHWDGQLIDDARLVVTVARTASAYGARIVTGARAEDVTGSDVTVRTADGTVRLSARQVIVAAGIWTEKLDARTPLTLSRGSHVLLDPASLGHPRAAVTVPVPGELGRYVFALPTADGPVIAGITDVAVPDQPVTLHGAPTADVDWILAQLSPAFARPLTAQDVIGSYAGFRPLVADAESSTADISRRHRVTRRPDGVITVTGGKLTTYRRMAQDALDASDLPGVCRTAALPLLGAQPRRTPAPDGVPARLVRRYGSEAPRVAAYGDTDPSLLDPVAPGVGVLGVEVVHAVRCEGATTVSDVMERRTRLSTVPAHAADARARVEEIVEAHR